ncbi:MAG: hypothetical protein FH757_12295 [Alcanivorax sp.]|jgi:hypothetical protein|nr:hypothetical protein [Alcanivorax sp.]
MNSNLMVGDLLVRNKGLASHVGLVVGAGVAHIWPGKPVTVTDLAEFTNGKPYQVVRAQDVKREELLARLEKLLQARKPYNVLTNNCEQIASYVLNGVRESPQLSATLIAAAMGALVSGESTNRFVGAFAGGLGGLVLYNWLMSNARKRT